MFYAGSYLLMFCITAHWMLYIVYHWVLLLDCLLFFIECFVLYFVYIPGSGWIISLSVKLWMLSLLQTLSVESYPGHCMLDATW